MTATNDTLFEQFVAAFEASADTDPLAFVRRAAPDARLDLASRIDAYLEGAPRRPLDQMPADDRSTEAIVDGLARSLASDAGVWPAMLPRLRDRARLRRADLVARLADALGVSSQREKVKRYYHEMELGTLPPDGVSDKVLDALAKILDSSRERLRDAGIQLGEPAPGLPRVVFMRTARGEAADQAAGSSAATNAGEAQFDEVDELFLGGP